MMKTPLTTSIWTEKQEYVTGEEIRVFFRGNKPYYARLLHIDAEGQVIQLIPNPYRNQDRFPPDEVISVPSPEDTFKLEVSSPFGKETIILYASTLPLENLQINPASQGLSVSRGDTRFFYQGKNREDLCPDEIQALLAEAEFSENRVQIITKMR